MIPLHLRDVVALTGGALHPTDPLGGDGAGDPGARLVEGR